MAELADALDSGSNVRKDVQVQVLLPAPKAEGQPFRGCPSAFLVGVKDLNRRTTVLFEPPVTRISVFISYYPIALLDSSCRYQAWKVLLLYRDLILLLWQNVRRMQHRLNNNEKRDGI